MITVLSLFLISIGDYGGFGYYDPGPDLSDESESGFEENIDHRFLFLIEGVLLTVVSILGVVGTVMSIGVLVKPAVRESFSALLTGLAVCDSLFLLTSLVIFGLPKLWYWFALKVRNKAILERGQVD